jgi:hypothetical protein
MMDITNDEKTILSTSDAKMDAQELNHPEALESFAPTQNASTFGEVEYFEDRKMDFRTIMAILVSYTLVLINNCFRRITYS